MNFTEVYRTLPPEDLLEIIDHPHRYQSNAVVAARLELDQRGIDESQYDNLRNIYNKKHQSRFAILWKKWFRGKKQ